MKPITEDRQPQASARSLTTWSQVLYDGLTPDERQALDDALRRVRARAGETTEDTSGFAIPVSLLPLMVVKIAEQRQQQPTRDVQRRSLLVSDC